MAILLNDNLDVAVNKPTDYRYGPYTSVASAQQSIPSIKRYKGLTVGIISGNSVTDYWFKEDITDVALVEKTSGSSGSGTSGASIIWKGEYAVGTSYVPLDAVSYNGSSYICVANTTGTEPTSIVTPLKWNLIASKGDAGSGSGSGVVIAGEVSVFPANLGQTIFYPINGYTSTNPNAYTVSVGGIEQVPTQNYLIGDDNGGSLILNEAPGEGAVILVRAAKVNPGGYFNWRGSYNALITYNLLDAVNYDGSSYISKSSQAITGVLPTDTAKWDVLARKGIDGSGTGGNVTQIQGRPVADTAPEAGQVLIWNDDPPQWEPGSILITGGTISFDTPGTHYFDVPSGARWSRLLASAGKGTDGTSGTDGQTGTTVMATDQLGAEYVAPGADGVPGVDGIAGRTIKVAGVVVAEGGAKGLGSGGGGGGGGAAAGTGGAALTSYGNSGTPAPSASGSTGGAGGSGGSNGSGDPSTALGGAGTGGGGDGGAGGTGLAPDNQTLAVSAGGSGGTNRGGGGGGGGAIAYNPSNPQNLIAYPGAGGKAGTPTLGGSGQVVDMPYNLTPFAGGQLVIEITEGAGDASITFTW